MEIDSDFKNIYWYSFLLVLSNISIITVFTSLVITFSQTDFGVFMLFIQGFILLIIALFSVQCWLVLLKKRRLNTISVVTHCLFITGLIIIGLVFIGGIVANAAGGGCYAPLDFTHTPISCISSSFLTFGIFYMLFSPLTLIVIFVLISISSTKLARLNSPPAVKNQE